MGNLMKFLRRPLFTVSGITLTVGALVAIVIAAYIYTNFRKKR
jgi:hypothetical protein